MPLHGVVPLNKALNPSTTAPWAPRVAAPCTAPKIILSQVSTARKKNLQQTGNVDYNSWTFFTFTFFFTFKSFSRHS
jgi:hypothetical protein